MLPVTGLVVRVHVQDAIIVDPVPAQVEALEHYAGIRNSIAEQFDKIIPGTCFENGAIGRFGDPGGPVDYRPQIESDFL
ncbi:MAG: hypothetical protein BGO93_25470 [Mesorhizobium sp. 65-26]|nr:MAG: hypothetical protein ABS57_03525 [Mesorhizobium sp. SCN 65-12]OJX82523.1 MAG: hypothetical protein BGO93_25470 [Mesorhizobium sp. 65-26]